MNESFVSVMDMLENQGVGYRGVQDEVMEMSLAVKRYMDQGLTPDEMVVAQAAREATVAASRALEAMFV